MTARLTAEMCSAGRELAEPRLSPTGDLVAYTVSWGGRSAVAITPVDGGAPERLLTSEPQPRTGRGLGGGCFDWLPDGRGIVYAGRDGALWEQRIDGGAPRLVVEASAERPAQAPAVAPDGRHVAYVVDLAEIWWVPLAGAGGRDAARPVRASGAVDFCADPAWTADGTGLAWQEWDVPNMAWDESRIVGTRIGDGTVVALQQGHSLQVQQPRYGCDGFLFTLRDDSGWLTVHRDGRCVLDEQHEHGGPTWGLGQRSFALSPDASRVAICRNEDGFGRLVVLDLATGDIELLARGVHGQVSWVGETIAALRSGARTPTQVVVYDVGPNPSRRTLTVGPVLGFEAADLTEPEPISFPADDGTTLYGRRYSSAGTAAAPRGLLCWLHGGPTDQWQVAFLPRFAYWMQQGWTILVPDHRGSTGHGRAYQQAMREQWGVLDVADTAAAIRHAHAQGWATPAGTVLVGGSAGGFTALNVLIHHPGLTAGGIVLYPVSDLAALDDTTHRFEAHYNHTLVGPPTVAAERYAHRSPLSRAAQLRSPVLVLHGDEDPVVPLTQSEALRDRVAAAGGDLELVVYAGEGHGFRLPVNQLDEYRRMHAFLDRVVP
jgi:dipeptidyl aminopeptidase/acylaminoacyl peptidase